MKKKSPQPELPKIAQVWKFILEKKYLSTNLWFQGAVHKSVPFQPQLKGERNFYSGKLSWKKVFFCKDGKWRQSFCNYRVITKVFLRIGFMTDSLPFMIFMNQFIVTQNLITALTGDKYFRRWSSHFFYYLDKSSRNSYVFWDRKSQKQFLIKKSYTFISNLNDY